jgi:hypothetical protein
MDTETDETKTDSTGKTKRAPSPRKTWETMGRACDVGIGSFNCLYHEAMKYSKINPLK